MWTMPTLRPSSRTSASQRRRAMLRTLRALTPARMKRKQRMLAMLAVKLRNRDLPRPKVMPPSLLLDPALPKTMSPLPQLHLPAALPSPLPLKFCLKTLQVISDPRYAGCSCKIYSISFGLLPEQVLFWFACLSMPDHLLAKSPSLFSCFLNSTTLATCLPYSAFDV
jgi:hypothetical protein